MDFGIAMTLLSCSSHLWFFPAVFWIIRHMALVTCNFSVPNFEDRRILLLKICLFGGPLFLVPFSLELEKEKRTIGCCLTSLFLQERKDEEEEGEGKCAGECHVLR